MTRARQPTAEHGAGRSFGTARSLWIADRRTAEVRREELAAPPGAVVVETRASAISRGTERLVFEGRVPASEFGRMRAPMQAGEFPFPVKYGYSAAGRVVAGPDDLVGRDVFALHPHQDVFAAPAAAVVPLPAGLAPERAVLAANMETALNILWDGGAAPGDRIVVVGVGLVGALVARLAARLPGADVTAIDVNPGRAALAIALGARFAQPDAAEGLDADLVVHCSASDAGLATALAAAGAEAVVVEASWYGDRPVVAGLGGGFHSRRLRLVSSQVGAVPPERRARWSLRRRLEAALGLLDDPALEALFTGETAFIDLAARYGDILDDPNTLCHRVRYT